MVNLAIIIIVPDVVYPQSSANRPLPCVLRVELVG